MLFLFLSAFLASPFHTLPGLSSPAHMDEWSWPPIPFQLLVQEGFWNRTEGKGEQQFKGYEGTKHTELTMNFQDLMNNRQFIMLFPEM